MPTRKISEITYPCTSSDHNPPSMMCWEDGVYEHVCSECGAKIIFTIWRPQLKVAEDNTGNLPYNLKDNNLPSFNSPYDTNYSRHRLRNYYW